MSSVLALVSKSGLKDLEKEHGALDARVVAPIRAYFSKNKRLQGLAEGGSLFMVTVRDERLELVAILENPSFLEDRWEAPPNQVPVTDITHLVPRLQFDNGKGLNPDMSRMAMALQTPRILTPEDVVNLRASAQPSPSTAYHAAVMATLAPEEKPRGPKRRMGEQAKVRRPIPPAERLTGPVPWSEALCTVEAWTSLTEDARAHALQDLATCLNESRGFADQHFEPSPDAYGVARLGALRHEPSGMMFLAVPGGTMVMGLAADDILSFFGALGDDQVQEILDTNQTAYFDLFDWSRPPHAVVVQPFLASRGLVDGDSLCRAVGVTEGEEHHVEAMHQLGFRLPSEAEWEWIGREGGAVRYVCLPVDQHPLAPTIVPPVNNAENGWGFADLLNEPQALADGWHDNYRGAPSTSAPWEPEAGPNVSRSGHTWWQSEEEAIALHAAARSKGDGAIRLTLDVPEPVPSGDPTVDWDAVATPVLDALTARRTISRARGVCSLAGQRALPGRDTTALVRSLIPRFGDINDKVLPSVVRYLGDAAHAAQSLGDDELASTVEGAMDLWLDLLAHKKPDVRSAATWLVAACQRNAAAAMQRIRLELTKERRQIPRAGLTLALAHLAAREGDPAPELDDLLTHKDALIRASAAVGSVWVRGADAISGELLSTLAAAAGVSNVPADALPWHEGRIGRAAYAMVASASEEARQSAARALIPRIRESRREGVARSALELVFEKSAEYLLPDALTSIQRELMEVLCELELDRPWMLKEFGIPIDLESRRRWLGVDPPSLVERPVTTTWHGESRTWPLWQWYETLLSWGVKSSDWDLPQWNDAIAKVLDPLDPVERLALFLERNRYRFDHKMRSSTGGNIGSLFRDLDADALVATAVAHDRDAVRRAALDKLDVSLEVAKRGGWFHTIEAMRALVATLDEGDQIDAKYVPVVPLDAQAPAHIFEWVPKQELEQRLFETVSDAINAKDFSVWCVFSPSTLGAVEHATKRVMSPRLARAILTLGVAGGSDTRAKGETLVGPWGSVPGIAELRAEYAKLMPVNHISKAREVVAALWRSK